MSQSIDLASEQCQACRPGAPQVKGQERAVLLQLIPAWEVVRVNDVERLHRSFVFSDFSQALAFTLRVGGLAEVMGHHPLIVTEWGRVSVDWWTHKIGGLHRNDFVAAAKTDSLYE